MKKCTYCGKEYPDDITVCEIDAQPVEGLKPPSPPPLRRGSSGREWFNTVIVTILGIFIVWLFFIHNWTGLELGAPSQAPYFVGAVVAAFAVIGLKRLLWSSEKQPREPEDRCYARKPGGAEFLYSLAALRDAYDNGEIGNAWTVRRDGDDEAKPVAEFLGVTPRTE